MTAAARKAFDDQAVGSGKLNGDLLRAKALAILR